MADLIRGRPGNGVYASCQIGQVLGARAELIEKQEQP